MVAAAAAAAASVSVFVAVAAAWAAVAAAECAAADSSSLQDSCSVITDRLSTMGSSLFLTYGLMSSHQQGWVVSYNLNYLFLLYQTQALDILIINIHKTSSFHWWLFKKNKTKQYILNINLNVCLGNFSYNISYIHVSKLKLEKKKWEKW